MQRLNKLRYDVGVKPSPAVRSPLGEAVRWAYTSANMRQADVARALGVRQGAVSDWAVGRFEPSLNTIRAIEECCGLEAGTILCRAGYVAPETALDFGGKVFRAREVVPDLSRPDVRRIWELDGLTEETRRYLVAELQATDDATQLVG